MPARFDHIALYVSHLPKSFVFYQKLFGLEEIPNPYPEGKHWLRIGPELELHLVEGMPAQWGECRNHISFSVPDLDVLTGVLREMGIKWSDFQGGEGKMRLRPDGVRQLYFKDPDGYWVEVNDKGKPLLSEN
jgi:lactoylglutathione lyase